jgi:type IV secretion system protein TrbI
MDMGSRPPLELDGPRRPVIRLNRRLLWVVIGVLAVTVGVAVYAIRTQGTRLQDPGTQPRTAPATPSAPWFQGVPDYQAPPQRAAILDTAAPPATTAAPKAPTAEEDEAQRRRRLLRAAMSAPIGVTTFERSGGDHALRRRAGQETLTAVPAGVVVAADRSQQPGDQPAAAEQPSPTRGDAATSTLPPDYLHASVRKPVSPYEVKAGTIIPAVMLTAINSDLPGQIIGQVRENVYDSDTGEHLLIPQGTRLVGLYDHHIVYGQQRVLITWKLLILPDGSSLSLKDGMPGTDEVGAAGFHDQVNNHYLRVFGNALLLSVIGAGVQLSQIPEFGQNFRGPTAGNVLGAAVGQQFGSTASEFVRRGMSLAPTLDVHPGFAFNVMVTQDIVFPGPYDERRQP